eukprot:1449526-Amphidinium_carterae.3
MLSHAKAYTKKERGGGQDIASLKSRVKRVGCRPGDSPRKRRRLREREQRKADKAAMLENGPGEQIPSPNPEEWS